ncbi:hypothetical protein E2C01_044825 [Portunus trituberculatus]|uniref:Uncharacterized protein n=1 Tax=Portunus trituberculatus TaxID=210409 RepID=A0A5B7FT45_PORTR|nr:hypothetical protein [Portunus trituberculatus]
MSPPPPPCLTRSLTVATTRVDQLRREHPSIPLHVAVRRWKTKQPPIPFVSQARDISAICHSSPSNILPTSTQQKHITNLSLKNSNAPGSLMAHRRAASLTGQVNQSPSVDHSGSLQVHFICSIALCNATPTTPAWRPQI